MTVHVGIAQKIAEIPGLEYSLDGGNIFVDKMPTTPDLAVGVFAQAGPEADSKLPYDAPWAQVVVRGDRSPLWAIETGRKIFALLHGKRNIELPDGTYLAWCLAVQSGFAHIGTDDNGRHQYSINFRTEILNPTEERP